jgi:hypothetical protein
MLPPTPSPYKTTSPPLHDPSKNHPVWVPHKPFFIHFDCSRVGSKLQDQVLKLIICYYSALKGLGEPGMEYTLLHKTKRIQVFNIRLNGELPATFAAGLIAKAPLDGFI